eukprot:2535289-Pleurochrysis_carterae.AAC.1
MHARTLTRTHCHARTQRGVCGRLIDQSPRTRAQCSTPNRAQPALGTRKRARSQSKPHWLHQKSRAKITSFISQPHYLRLYERS